MIIQQNTLPIINNRVVISDEIRVPLDTALRVIPGSYIEWNKMKDQRKWFVLPGQDSTACCETYLLDYYSILKQNAI